MQLILNEFVIAANKDYSITAGAFTKARKKLKHTAFTELNNDIIGIYYKDQNIKRFSGFRLLAFDGSKIMLPENNAIRENSARNLLEITQVKILENIQEQLFKSAMMC